MQLDAFETVTEFGVALAGFSALAATLTHKPGALTPLDRVRTINLLSTTLTPAFVALFPAIGESFGVSGTALWRGTSVGLTVVVVAAFGFSLSLFRSLSAADRAGLSPVLWVFFVGINALVVVAQVINASAALAAPGPGPILASLVALLFLGAQQLVRIVIVRPVEPSA